MRKIKIMEHISLDGVIQHEKSEDFAYSDWTTPYRSAEGLQLVMETQGNRFDLLLGRRTYDLWTQYWPKAGDSAIANSINAATKYIATHRPESLEWGPVNDLGTDIAVGISQLKTTDGPDLIVWGSSSLTSLLLEQGLVDEVILIVYPVLLGQGKRFFSDRAAACHLQLLSSKTTSTGVIMNTYQYAGLLPI
ncbi:dihydrofolate reductase family protein [Pedobacter sp. GSP4]|uniref:dihydrofolate reductase family protein n=1 Tax=Pedobacter sp. GSP4 TaxID=3453716 RepID=UPI003EEB8F7C